MWSSFASGSTWKWEFRGEVLDDVAKDLSIADDIANVVEGVDGGNEESNLTNRRPGMAAR